MQTQWVYTTTEMCW